MEAAKVNSGTVGGAAVVDYITIDRAVGVSYGAAGRQQGGWFSCRQSSKGQRLAAGGSSKISVSCRAATVKSESAASMAAVCPGGSTVPATGRDSRLSVRSSVYQLVDR